MYDTILTGGRIVDPSQNLDAMQDIAFKDGSVAALGANIDGSAAETIDVTGKIVAPGLIDIHAHVNWGATYLSVEPEPVAQKSGTTTFVDAGSAGAGTFHGFRKHIIEASPLRMPWKHVYPVAKLIPTGQDRRYPTPNRSLHQRKSRYVKVPASVRILKCIHSKRSNCSAL